MEDLWSSPWASDLSSGKLDDFPSAPQTVHFSVPQHSLPRKISQNLSPWHDDDAWGDVQHVGQKLAPSWRRSSPGRRAAREPSPDPWKAVEDMHFEARADLGKWSRGRQGSQHQKKMDTTPPKEEQAKTTAAVEVKDESWGAEPEETQRLEPKVEARPSPEAEVVKTEAGGAEEQAEESPRAESIGETDVSDLAPEASHAPVRGDVDAEASTSEPDTVLAPKPAPLFPIDFAALDDLFPTTGPVDTDPEPVPDVIIDDTFTTMSERKMWYRISRFGSSRKHDSGEDDHYIRVNWPNSKVRDQVIKTVRRWAEEESATGRVSRGGRPGASGSSLFHWDSKAPPVQIGELLERRSKSTQHARHASEKIPTAMSPGDEMGWADASPSSPTTAKPKQRPLSMGHLASAPLPNPWADAAPSSSLKPAPLQFSPLKFPPLKTSPVRPSNLKNVESAEMDQDSQDADADDANDNDDDDEWGEMVGTSAVGDVGDVFGPLSETARASLESVKGDMFDGESPLDKTHGEAIVDQPTSASTLFDVSHCEDDKAPPGETLAAFPFPAGYVTPPITPTPSALAAPLPSLSEGLSLDASYRKASLAQAIAMSSPATSVSDKEVEMDRAREEEEEEEAEAMAAEIIRGLPDLTYMLR